MTGMTVREATLATAITIHHETPVHIAEAFLIEANSAEIYVNDQQGLLIGVIPDYEFIKYRLLNPSGILLARHIMSPVSICLSPSTPLEVAAELLRENIHARLPVVANQRVIGQVTRSTVLKVMTQPTQNIYTATSEPESFSPLNVDVIPKPKFLLKQNARQAIR